MPTNNTRGLWRGKRNNKNSTKYGEWYQGIDVMHKTVRGELCLCNPCEVWVSVDPSTLGECTGLRDKNGKLIFEGDIIKHNGECHVIKYLEKYMRFSPTKPGTVFAVFDYTQSEIIGNIHDNPELLKGENNVSQED